MKTIEERAYEKSLKMLNPWLHHTPTTRELLVEMATEQRAIDQKKACLNFCVACPTYENCDTRYNCPIYDKFEKALED